MNFQQEVSLKNYSNYKIGGPAKYFVEVSSVEELKGVIAEASSLTQRIFILGGATNILISDRGFDGLVIHNKIGGITRNEDGVEVGSGVLVKDFLEFCIENSLSGWEWAGGLPGTMGGAVRGNAGAFRGETKDSVVEVKSLDLKNLTAKRRTNEECRFGYRNSVFKSGEGKGEFITSVTMKLSLGDKETIRKNIQEKIDYRNAKHPMEYPNIGSTFKNIPLDSLSKNQQEEFKDIIKTDPFPVVPTTKLLALCNLKGKRAGGAMISDKHPNFIVNIDNASSEDVKTLISLAKETVKMKYNITLQEEIIYLD